MSNTDRHPECHMRTALGNCDPIGGFCTSVNEAICEALHKAAEPKEVYCPMASRTCFTNGKEVAWCLTCPHISEEDRELVKKAVEGSQPKKERWIPIKWHYITDEEREENGYPKDWVYYLDCKMPEDEQEILVTTNSGRVEKDVCYLDGGFSLDSGWDWIEDIVAWMPLPKPYRKEKDQ